jgi:hypothetical protein
MKMIMLSGVEVDAEMTACKPLALKDRDELLHRPRLAPRRLVD